MQSVKEQVLNKVEELGIEAPKFFGYAAKTIESWKKKPNTIPLRAVEKVLAGQEPNQPTVRQSSASVVPPRNPDPMMSPPPEQPAEPQQPTIAPAPPYTIQNAQADIVAIVQHFNNTVSPVIQETKNQCQVNANMLSNLADNLRALNEWKSRIDGLVPSQQNHSPTVGQLLASQPSDTFNQLSTPQDLPSRINPAGKAQVIAEYHPPNQPNGNPLDTGIAPSAADRARSLNALADRQDPRNPGRPAGPATPPPQDAPGMLGWSRPWPAKK